MATWEDIATMVILDGQGGVEAASAGLPIMPTMAIPLKVRFIIIPFPLTRVFIILILPIRPIGPIRRIPMWENIMSTIPLMQSGSDLPIIITVKTIPLVVPFL